MKKLGIIGGTSWASTARYYDIINRSVAQRLGGLHSATLAIESLDLAAVVALQRADDWAAVGRLGAEAGRRLAASGAEALILASHTLHKVADAIVAASGIPILDVSDATADRIVADGRRRIALLGTRFTMGEAFARDRYTDRGISLQAIDARWQSEIDRIIYEELARGQVVRESQRKLKTLITELGKQKVEAIVLGCAELGHVVDARANVLPIYDTTVHHARRAVDWMLGDELETRVAA